MSTDRKRLNSAIQRIAREDPEIRALLKDFRNSGGKPSESATSGSGAEDRQICCDGGTSGSTNPGSDTRDTGDGGQDGLGDDPANLDDLRGGSLTGVTDCATGTPICFEGSDWIPPDGWESPTDPPVDPDWDGGVTWYTATINGSTTSYASCQAAKDGASAIRESLGCGPKEPQNCINFSTTTWGCYSSELEQNIAISITMDQKSCDNDYNSAFCDPENPPTVDEWPQDGCVNLATKGGKLVGSKYDPENDGSWSAPRDEVELCDAFGNSFKLKASGSIEGGWKSISAQNPGDGYLYNAQGQQIARISESEYSDPTM